MGSVPIARLRDPRERCTPARIRTKTQEESMTGRLEGTVALITGGARGQGRAHAIRMAEEGADIVVTDLCEQLPFVPYAMGTREELDETLAEVEKRDRRCLAITADARDSAQMRDAIARTVNEL